MNHGSDTTYDHLGTLYKALEFLKLTADMGIIIHPVPLRILARRLWPFQILHGRTLRALRVNMDKFFCLRLRM